VPVIEAVAKRSCSCARERTRAVALNTYPLPELVQARGRVAGDLNAAGADSVFWFAALCLGNRLDVESHCGERITMPMDALQRALPVNSLHFHELCFCKEGCRTSPLHGKCGQHIVVPLQQPTS
jgi:hypothetical protein